MDYLVQVARVADVNAFADEMFRAKSNMDGLDIHEVRSESSWAQPSRAREFSNAIGFSDLLAARDQDCLN